MRVPYLVCCVLTRAHRVRKDHYKGMTDAEKKAILATQLAQMEEVKARRAAQAAEDAQYARTQADILRAMDAQVSLLHTHTHTHTHIHTHTDADCACTEYCHACHAADGLHGTTDCIGFALGCQHALMCLPCACVCVCVRVCVCVGCAC